MRVVTGGIESSPTFAFTSNGNGDEFSFKSFYGEIYTNKVFDLDVTPAVQSDFEIRVVVTAGEQTETRTFRIQIVDINDHAPIFSPSLYTATISEDRSSTSAIVFNNGANARC